MVTEAGLGVSIVECGRTAGRVEDMSDIDRLLADYARNFPAFERQEALLEQEHLGQFALYCSGELVGVYDTSEEADAVSAAHGNYAVFKIGRQPLRFAMPA